MKLRKEYKLHNAVKSLLRALSYDNHSISVQEVHVETF